MWIKDLRRSLAIGLAVLMAVMTLPMGLAQAKMVTTDQVIEQSAPSDEEVQQIAGRLDELPAGEGFVGVVIGAALIIFLVLLITDLLGLTDVYPFVNK